MIKSLLFKRPLLVIFDVTKRCNSKCSICSIWRNPSKVEDELKLKQIKDIFEDLYHFGARQVFLQGGEPLLRHDIFEIIELLISIGFKPTIITNGLLLNKKTVLRLASLKCNVGISLDTLKPARYKRIRGVDAFNLVKNNLLFASRVKRKKGVWAINSTITDINHGECLDLYDFAVSNGFDFFIFPYNYSLCKISSKDQALVFKSNEKIIKAFSELLDKMRESKEIIKVLVFEEIIKYLKGDYIKPCDALHHSLMLDERGRVGPCIELSHEFDLTKESINAVWPKFNRERVEQCYLRTPCFYGCTRSLGILASNWFKLASFGLRNSREAKRLLSII